MEPVLPVGNKTGKTIQKQRSRVDYTIKHNVIFFSHVIYSTPCPPSPPPPSFKYLLLLFFQSLPLFLHKDWFCPSSELLWYLKPKPTQQREQTESYFSLTPWVDSYSASQNMHNLSFLPEAVKEKSRKWHHPHEAEVKSAVTAGWNEQPD